MFMLLHINLHRALDWNARVVVLRVGPRVLREQRIFFCAELREIRLWMGLQAWRWRNARRLRGNFGVVGKHPTGEDEVQSDRDADHDRGKHAHAYQDRAVMDRVRFVTERFFHRLSHASAPVRRPPSVPPTTFAARDEAGRRKRSTTRRQSRAARTGRSRAARNRLRESSARSTRTRRRSPRPPASPRSRPATRAGAWRRATTASRTAVRN